MESHGIIRSNRRGDKTKGLLLDVAEHLIAQRGVDGVSTRAIATAAGQANHSSIRHHFRTKIELVRAVLEHRAGRIEVMRAAMISAMPDPLDAHHAIEALVRPFAAHMSAHGKNSHYFRFVEQAIRHFGLAIVAQEMQAAPSLVRCVAALTGPVSADPLQRARAYLVVNMIWRGFADREQAASEDMLIIDDDSVFANLLIDTAGAAFTAVDLHRSAKSTKAP
jgi:AcrR family transcriptional regulator